MPLQVGIDAIFCLDFARGKSNYVPYETTIPGLVYRKLSCDRTAFEFDSEKVTMSFGKIKNEMEKFAAGLLSIGLKQEDRILICGNNYSNLLIAVLGSARNGMIFSIGSPNFQNASQIQHLLSLGEFNAFIYFGESDCVNQFLLQISPEMIKYPKGKLKLKAFPKLSHVIYADENHKHSGTYTLSDIFLNGSNEQIEKLPKIDEKNCHKIGSIQFTMGTTNLPKAVALTHYQIINGCRIAANAIGIKKETVLCTALPLFRIPIFALSIFSPLLFESKTIFPEPNPLPKFLFDSINKYQCTNLLSNATALRLILRTQPLIQKKQITLTSIDTVILLGERVSADLLISIENLMPKAKKIAVGMISTELGAIPILSDQTTNLIKSVGKILEGFEADIIKIDNLPNNDGVRRGGLLLKALAKTKFKGFAPSYKDDQEWIGTDDVVCFQKDGNIEIISHIQDLVFDKIGRLVEYWKLERLLAQLVQQIKGVQIIQLEKGSPIVAVVVPKRATAKLQIAELKKEIVDICREQQLPPPDQLAILEEFPRVNTKIQKYKLREELRTKKLQIY